MSNTTPSRQLPRTSKALAIFFLLGFLVAPAFSQQDVEQRKIDYLLSSIADLHDAVFIRNGSEYDAPRAADHLRLKLRYAGGRVKTAEDFIIYCATGSSMTGNAYQIKFADGRVVATAAFLRDKLAEYSAQEENISRVSSGE
jgi:hypothetical protein